MAGTFLVLVSGTEFWLSLAQIQYDAPNAFTQHFHPSIEDASAGPNQPSLVLDCDPELFAIIVQYLRGYDILPLAPTAVPRTLSLDAAKRGLLRDADVLHLSGLRSMLQASIDTTTKFLNWSGVASEVVSLVDFLEGRDPVGSKRTDAQFVDRRGRSILIHTRGTGMRLTAASDSMPFASSRRPLGFSKHVNLSRPVFRIELYEHPHLQELIVYGQASPNAHCIVDGRSGINFDVLPMKTPMMIDEAWFSFTTAWLHQDKDNKAICGYHLRLHAIKARTKSCVIAGLDYHSLVVEVEDADEVTLAGG